MTDAVKNWKDYQAAVAASFRTIGFNAIVDARVPGARNCHDVDVYVTFSQFGIEHRWIVECKYWKARVSKEKILALKGVVDDTGADRGIIICENGFQSGALAATAYTNILAVTSLEDFKQTLHIEKASRPLVRKESAQPTAPPIFTFPDGNQPQHLLAYEGRVFVANWQAGNISIVNPGAKSIESVIHLDKYKSKNGPINGQLILPHQPGEMACAEGKLFVGQVFSDFVLVIDIETQTIIRRINLPGGGEGAISASPNGRHVFFASSKMNSLFVIDSATYEFYEIKYPAGCNGGTCVLSHPAKPLIYVGICGFGRGFHKGVYFSGGSALLTCDLNQRRHISLLCIPNIERDPGVGGWPICLTFDELKSCLYLGMFQSGRGICKVDEKGQNILANFQFATNARNKYFAWVDPLSQVLHRGKLLSINRNNFELATLDKHTGQMESAIFLGEAPNGPRAIVIIDDEAIISYPNLEGLIFLDLAAN